MIATLPSARSKRILTVAPMPPEKQAYALARYSRSADSIRESIEWVRSHDSAKFLESFYFQYGHASIADLGHVTVCFEGVSEAAAIEIEDEQLWDGQARSSRYQDFSKAAPVVPPEFTPAEASTYRNAADSLLDVYRQVQQRAFAFLEQELPRPADMKPDAYARNINARAFDIARYLLPLGVPTGLGQVTSIRTLEKQIRRLKASEFEEVRELGEELADSCRTPATCLWNTDEHPEPVAPTLARYAERDDFPGRLRANVAEWAADHLPKPQTRDVPAVDLLQPTDPLADICASLLYAVSDRPYRELYELACEWPGPRKKDLLQVALGTRSNRDELPRQFRGANYVLDLVIDIGAYRDFHRHRRCHQLRQFYTNRLGYETPELAERCGVADLFQRAYSAVDSAMHDLPQPAAQYMLPFGARSRFLFKMDFAELEYVSKLRSGVKGHISYRKVAWEMKQALERHDPALGELIQATPPWEEDLLRR